MTDNELLELIQKDRKKGFKVLIKQNQDMILNLAYSYLGSKEESEDLAQEAFIKIYYKIHTFKGMSKLSTWMYRITVNMCKDKLRESYKLKTVPLESHKTYLHSKEHNFDQKEIQELVHNAIINLPLKYRTIIILKEFEEKSYKEIASILQCSIGTIESRLHRARKILKKTLIPVIDEEVFNEL